MPNILKNLLNHTISTYKFPSESELPGGEEPPSAEEQGMPEEVSRPESPPATPIDYAQAQANAIVQDAKAEAEEEARRILAKAEEEAEKVRTAAREGGYRQGYAEGMAASSAEARAQQAELAVRLTKDVQAFLEKAQTARDAMMDGAVEELKDLSMAVAEKVVRVSLKSSSDIIGRMIMAAIEKKKRKEWVHIYIAGCDAKNMAQLSPELSAALSGLSDRVRIIPMSDDESGTCIIEMNDEIVDASAATQLSNLRSALDGSAQADDPLRQFGSGF